MYRIENMISVFGCCTALHLQSKYGLEPNLWYLRLCTLIFFIDPETWICEIGNQMQYRLVIIDVIEKIFDRFKILVQSRKCHEGLPFLASLIVHCQVQEKTLHPGAHTKRILESSPIEPTQTLQTSPRDYDIAHTDHYTSAQFPVLFPVDSSDHIHCRHKGRQVVALYLPFNCWRPRRQVYHQRSNRDDDERQNHPNSSCPTTEHRGPQGQISSSMVGE